MKVEAAFPPILDTHETSGEANPESVLPGMSMDMLFVEAHWAKQW